MSQEFTRKINQLRELIGEDKLKEAFKEFAFMAEEFGIPVVIRREMYVIKNGFHEVEKEYILKGLPYDDYNYRRGNAVRKFLQLLDDSEDHFKNLTIDKSDLNVELSNIVEGFKSEIFLRAFEISKNYPGFCLEKTSLSLDSGTITAIVGKNASGKSTLMRLLAGVEKIDSGYIEYFGETNIKDWYVLKKKIGYIPQHIHSKSLRLIDILKAEAITHGISPKDLEFYLQDAITKMNLEDEIHKAWDDLSGGFQMRFELAKTIIWRPKILILDEPLANLDILTQRLFLKDIREYSKSVQYPISIVITSQHLEEIEGIADRIIFLEEGKTIFNGRLEELGKERDFNLYELGIHVTQQEEVIELIKSMKEKVIIEKEFFDIITVKLPLDVEIIKIINLLYKNNIRFNFIRDITFSTRKLFSMKE